MKKRKLIAILSCIAVAGTLLTGCSDTSTDAEQNTAVISDTTEEVSDNDPVDTSDEVESVFLKDASIEETTLVDQDGICITAKDLTYNDYYATLDLVLENNTDEDLSFISGSLGYCCNSISGYMIPDIYINEDVSAGKSSNASITISLEELAIYGITEIADIEIGFEVENDDYDDVLVTGPLSILTSANDTYDYATDTYKQALDSKYLETALNCNMISRSEEVLFEQEGIRLIDETLVENTDGEKIMLLEFENTSDASVNVCTSSIAVNGVVLSSGGTWDSETINPGKRMLMELDFNNMQEDGSFDLSNISEVSLNLDLRDVDYNQVGEEQEIVIPVTAAEAGAESNTSAEALYSEDGISIYSNGIVDDEYGTSLHLVFLISNDSGQDITIMDDYDSLSVNDKMIDYAMFSTDIPDGKSGLVDVEIFESALEENDITGVDDIENAEITFEVRDADYNELMETKVEVSYK